MKLRGIQFPITNREEFGFPQIRKINFLFNLNNQTSGADSDGHLLHSTLFFVYFISETPFKFIFLTLSTLFLILSFAFLKFWIFGIVWVLVMFIFVLFAIRNVPDNERVSKIMHVVLFKSGAWYCSLNQSGIRVSPEIVEDVLMKRFKNAGMLAFCLLKWAEKVEKLRAKTSELITPRLSLWPSQASARSCGILWMPWETRGC